jgi:Family of unknown function (DUF5947)
VTGPPGSAARTAVRPAAGAAAGRAADAQRPPGAFARVIRRAAARPRGSGRLCELCGEPVPAGHRHLLEGGAGGLLCACRACCLLFSDPAASEGRYRLVPERRVRLARVPLAALGVPVGLVFFVIAADGTVTARYPSPAGATQWQVPPAAWAGARRDCPALATVLPEVEAVLACALRERREAWLVPVDDCYRLVAVVREHWRGLSGGDQVWPEIGRFFDGLREV